jgi:hypothetical protein
MKQIVFPWNMIFLPQKRKEKKRKEMTIMDGLSKPSINAKTV